MMEVSIQARSIGKGGGGLPLLFLAANLYIKKLNDHGVAPLPQHTLFWEYVRNLILENFFLLLKFFLAPPPTHTFKNDATCLVFYMKYNYIKKNRIKFIYIY